MDEIQSSTVAPYDFDNIPELEIDENVDEQAAGSDDECNNAVDGHRNHDSQYQDDENDEYGDVPELEDEDSRPGGAFDDSQSTSHHNPPLSSLPFSQGDEDDDLEFVQFSQQSALIDDAHTMDSEQFRELNVKATSNRD